MYANETTTANQKERGALKSLHKLSLLIILVDVWVQNISPQYGYDIIIIL